METDDAIAAFAALSQHARLSIVQHLVAAGPEGITAGTLARLLDMRANTLSANLAVLLRAGLVQRVRRGREMQYSANAAGLAALIGFLLRDCCGGRPELCAPALAAAGMARKDTSMPDTPDHRPFSVLFLCTGNSARSLLAEAIIAREAPGRFQGYSAGSDPKPEPHPYTLDLLRGLNHDTGFARSKSWSEFAGPDAPEMDFVITVCDSAAAETCPIWPGQPMTAHWGVPDPAAATGGEAAQRLAFADAYRMLRNRISIFVSLPISTLDRFALQDRLDAIGRDEVPAAPAPA